MKQFLAFIVLFFSFYELAISQPQNDPWSPLRVDAQHLPNAIRVNSNLISGGLPEGEASFAELRRLRIKTIISVDGAKPNVELARIHGMRYVHLPQGYDGISEFHVRELAKAISDLEGPIYLHCHHGKHRSPVAAAAACIATGCMTNEQGKTLLEFAGTGANYLGLWRTVARASSLPKAELSSLTVNFPEIAEVPPMAKAMVALDATYERVSRLQSSEWQMDSERYSESRHQLQLLREHFAELLRLEANQGFPSDFVEQFTTSERASERLVLLFKSDAIASREERTIQSLNAAFSTVRDSCQNCHFRFRDQAPFQKH
jgi:protein tyrosine phosphatase (PTP) superfamily phosphohydrolase (DUF442 family)/cytochrome c556